jgi:8-oxo-dGTP diphosphatase
MNKMHNYENINWSAWKPTEQAVIVYIVDKEREQVLFIHKKTGLGQGKVSAPGGRLEAGESFLEAAVRECQEEVSVTPLAPVKRMELYFQFTSGYALYGEAFFAERWEGEPLPSAEADPFWCSLNEIPWDKMWEDDRYWLLQAMAGKKMQGFYVFNDDKMFSQKLVEIENFD